MKKLLLLFGLLLFFNVALFSQISLTFEGQVYSENFNNYLGTSGTVPSNWIIPGPFRGTGTGSSSTGGCYAFGNASEYSNGYLRSGSTGNMTTTISFTNNTGNPIVELDIAYDFEQWRYRNTSGLDASASGIGASVDGLDQNGVSTGTDGVPTITPKSITLSGLSISDGATFSVSFTTTDVTGSDNGLSIDDFQLTVVSAPLPVDFISFDVSELKESVALTWSTASEENNAHFEIEHSTNSRDFQTLDKVYGVGTTSEIQQYNYIHEGAVTGKNFYRLRQVDFDGAFEYSQVAVVEMKGDGQVNIRPTLADDQVTLSFGEAIREEAQLQVFDIAGRQVNTLLLASGTEQFELTVASLEKGLYFIQLQLNGEINTLKFVKR